MTGEAVNTILLYMLKSWDNRIVSAREALDRTGTEADRIKLIEVIAQHDIISEIIFTLFPD